MIKINKRLSSLGDLILEGNSKSIIDVGCDHALLDIYLINKNPSLGLTASDLREEPLNKAKENIEKYSLSNKIKTKLSYGIDDLEDDIDTVVISGMGTETIIEILSKGSIHLGHVNRLVISSNNKYYELRKYITSIGYVINKEQIIYEDNKYYITIDFIKGNKKYNYKELYFGPYLINNKDNMFYEYYNFILNKKKEVLKSIDKDNIKEEIELIGKEIQ